MQLRCMDGWLGGWGREGTEGEGGWARRKRPSATAHPRLAAQQGDRALPTQLPALDSHTLRLSATSCSSSSSFKVPCEGADGFRLGIRQHKPGYSEWRLVSRRTQCSVAGHESRTSNVVGPGDGERSDLISSASVPAKPVRVMVIGKRGGGGDGVVWGEGYERGKGRTRFLPFFKKRKVRNVRKDRCALQVSTLLQRVEAPCFQHLLHVHLEGFWMRPWLGARS